MRIVKICTNCISINSKFFFCMKCNSLLSSKCIKWAEMRPCELKVFAKKWHLSSCWTWASLLCKSMYFRIKSINGPDRSFTPPCITVPPHKSPFRLLISGVCLCMWGEWSTSPSPNLTKRAVPTQLFYSFPLSLFGYLSTLIEETMALSMDACNETQKIYL